MGQNGNGPVMFSLPSLNENLETNNSGFDTPAVDSHATMEAYKIPPVLWMLVFLIGGYFGLRWVMED